MGAPTLVNRTHALLFLIHYSDLPGTATHTPSQITKTTPIDWLARGNGPGKKGTVSPLGPSAALACPARSPACKPQNDSRARFLPPQPSGPHTEVRAGL